MSKLFLTPQQLNKIFNESQDKIINLSPLHCSPVSYNEIQRFDEEFGNETILQLKKRINDLEAENQNLKSKLSHNLKNNLVLHFCKTLGSGSTQAFENSTGFHAERSTIKRISDKIKDQIIHTKSTQTIDQDYNVLLEENNTLKKNNNRLEQQIHSVKETLKQFTDLNNLLAKELQSIKDSKQINKGSSIQQTKNYSILTQSQVNKQLILHTNQENQKVRNNYQDQMKQKQRSVCLTSTSNPHSFYNEKQSTGYLIQIFLDCYSKRNYQPSQSFLNFAPQRAMTPTPIINQILNRNQNFPSTRNVVLCSRYLTLQ